MKLSFEFNGIFISVIIFVVKCDGMWVEAADLSDNVVRVSEDYLSRNFNCLIYDLIHEAWHLRQKKIYGEGLLNLKKVQSSSPFSNYSAFNRAEEEAEAFALLVTKGIGATKLYIFDTQEKVDWLLRMKTWFSSKGFETPSASWAQKAYQDFLVTTSPPPLPWEILPD